ncbi:bifunctional metallophosphatase/5'-nucleotidase [Haloarcula sp. GH36]|uniref:bifunctional metallophosphatase/5'-nucleotidase n=1 Tax=Haloarcula montana TaxID=3111776 RepID=UPI002D76EE77|nr:bifunctional metallophosphatase/5'-nucleotidase [Haloarcula sp. GH36]
MSLTLLHYSDIETALDDPERCARLAGAIDERRGADTVVVGTGDNTAPGALPLATDGRIALEFFEAVEPDVDTFGNHDFDFGVETARELAGSAPQTWLCANATLDGERFAAAETIPHTVVETEHYRIGVVGVAHPETDEINPAADSVDFHDPVPAVRESAATLRERDVDFVVVASHCGEGDSRIARETDVDAVLGGHVHDVHVETVADTVVVRPGRAARYVAVVQLGTGTDVTVHEIGDDHRHDGLAATLADRLATTGLDEVVATVAEPIELTEEAVTVAESRAGNFVTDALRWRAGADVAISPTGALRSGDPLAGAVTVADLIGLAPYRDDLTLVELSGERLRSALAAVPVGAHNDAFPRRFCSHLSGARIVFDDEADELRSATVDGEPVDPEATYTLAVAEYLVETDHVVGVFGPDDVVERCGVAHDAIVEYAREGGIDPDIGDRIERPTLDR